MKRRIAVIVEYFPPRLGGDRRIFELLRRLSDRLDIHFIILPPSYVLFIRKIEKYSKEEERFSYQRMTGHRLNMPKPVLRIWTYSFLLAFAVSFVYLALRLLRKVAELKPDIVIVNNTSAYTGLLGLVSSKLMNKKLLVEYNDLQALYTVELLKGRLDESLLRPLGRLLVSIEDVIVKNGWKVTAITGFIKRYAEERGTRQDITVIPDGVDTDFFNPSRFDRREIRSKYGIRDEEILCVYAGRIDICAGGELLIETVDLLDHRNIRFMLVGEGDPSLLKECCMRPNVILTGLVPREDVPRYLVAADIVLVPFPNNLASHSISPLKLFEALAMEKIVIASDVSGIREVVTDGCDAILVPDIPGQWAVAIARFLEEPEELLSSRKRNREIVRQRYDWQILSERFLRNAIEAL